MRLPVMAVSAALLLNASAAFAQEIGVASCDNFLKTYSTCVGTKVPESLRGSMNSILDKVKTNWKEVAATAEGKANLETTCKETADKMKAQVASLGCTW